MRPARFTALVLVVLSLAACGEGRADPGEQDPAGEEEGRQGRDPEPRARVADPLVARALQEQAGPGLDQFSIAFYRV